MLTELSLNVILQNVTTLKTQTKSFPPNTDRPRLYLARHVPGRVRPHGLLRRGATGLAHQKYSVFTHPGVQSELQRSEEVAGLGEVLELLPHLLAHRRDICALRGDRGHFVQATQPASKHRRRRHGQHWRHSQRS